MTAAPESPGRAERFAEVNELRPSLLRLVIRVALASGVFLAILVLVPAVAARVACGGASEPMSHAAGGALGACELGAATSFGIVGMVLAIAAAFVVYRATR